MALTINTNIGSLIAANQLNQLNKQGDRLAEQATTGKRIRNSSDDAAGLAVYMGMKSQLTGNTAALQNISRGNDLLSTQEGMYKQFNDIYDRMKTLATAAADETMSDADRAKSNTELQSQMQELDRIAKSTEYNGIKLADGSVTSLNLQVGAGTSASDKIAVSLSDMQVSSLTITGGGISSAANAATFLGNLKTDMDSLATKMASNGALVNRLDFASKNLTSMNENLEKSMGTIMDADMAKVAADQSKNQALQQLGLSMLTRANQQPLNYLSLFA
jgi:flagellin